MREDQGSDLSWIKPRTVDPMPRCPFCKDEAPVVPEGTYRPRAMVHPAHPHGPCIVRVEGVPCPCTAGSPL
jgi:hypothetical protein